MKPELEYIRDEIKILNGLYDYIKQNPNDCVMDTIKEYAFDKNLDLGQIGYLISQNKELKDYCERNLKKFKFIQTLKQPKDL